MKALYVAMQDPDSRRWAPVARLRRENGHYLFDYKRGPIPTRRSSIACSAASRRPGRHSFSPARTTNFNRSPSISTTCHTRNQARLDVITDSAESIRRRAFASGCLRFLAGRDCLSAASSLPCPPPPIRCKAHRLAARRVAAVGAEGRLLVTGRHRRLRRHFIVALLQRPLARALCRPAHASPTLAQRARFRCTTSAATTPSATTREQCAPAVT